MIFEPPWGNQLLRRRRTVLRDPMFYPFWARGGGRQASEFAEYDSFLAPRAKSFVMAVLRCLFLVSWSAVRCPNCKKGCQKEIQSDQQLIRRHVVETVGKDRILCTGSTWGGPGVEPRITFGNRGAEASTYGYRRQFGMTFL